MRYAKERTGSVASPVLVWWTSWPLVPFFWLEIFIVADVAVSKMLSGAVLGMGLLLAHRVTLQTRNCCVRRLSFLEV